MVMDYGAISEGIVSGLATHHLAKLTSEDKAEIHTQALVDLCETLRDLHSFLRSQTHPDLSSDVYEAVTLYKVGLGSPWLPRLKDHLYMRILQPYATVFNVSSSLLGPPFLLTFLNITPDPLWIPFDFPDGTVFILDATATQNQINMYVRYTNIPPE